MNMEHARLEESHQYTEFVTFCIKKNAGNVLHTKTPCSANLTVDTH